jgi:hypothetical protein
MTRIFCKPLWCYGGLIRLIALPMAMVLLPCAGPEPAAAAGSAAQKETAARANARHGATTASARRRSEQLLGASIGSPRRARLTRTSVPVHDPSVSILSTPPAIWRQPSGDPTALDPSSIKASHTTSPWSLQGSSLSFSGASPRRAVNFSTGEPTVTTFVTSGADDRWSTVTKPLPAAFSPY